MCMCVCMCVFGGFLNNDFNLSKCAGQHRAWCICLRHFILLIFLNFIYLEQKSESEGNRGREKERENPKQTPCCQHRARCGAPSHKV